MITDWFPSYHEAEDFAQSLSWYSMILEREGGWVVYS